MSSLQRRRDLAITPKTAWYWAHRIRDTGHEETEPLGQQFGGRGEADATYIGGPGSNKPAARSPVGKTPMVGWKDRAPNQVKVQEVARSAQSTLKGSGIRTRSSELGCMYTDAARAYQGLHRRQEAVTHTVGAYVREQARPHGPESFRTGWKRGQDGVYLHFSTKHLDRRPSRCYNAHMNWKKPK